MTDWAAVYKRSGDIFSRYSDPPRKLFSDTLNPFPLSSIPPFEYVDSLKVRLTFQHKVYNSVVANFELGSISYDFH
jgi:hypothetical protein